MGRDLATRSSHADQAREIARRGLAMLQQGATRRGQQDRQAIPTVADLMRSCFGSHVTLRNKPSTGVHVLDLVEPPSAPIRLPG